MSCVRHGHIYLGIASDIYMTEKPNFTVATMNPPLVLGPIVHYLNSLEALNTSNQRVRDMIQGKSKKEIAETGYVLFFSFSLTLRHLPANTCL